MIKLNVNHTRLTASNLESLVEGNIRSILIKLIFSSEWEHLARIAVFANGETKVSVSLSDDVCAIPWEVLFSPGEVIVSLRGLGDSGEYVICTENKSLGKVEKSNANANVSEAEEATPDVIEALLADFAQVMESGGPAGENGKSAYELAVDNGFDGTVEQWLSSLKGEGGSSGVYVGSGEIPEDCNIQIDPDGVTASLGQAINANLINTLYTAATNEVGTYRTDGNIRIDYPGASEVHLIYTEPAHDDWFELYPIEFLKANKEYTLSFDCSGVGDIAPVFRIESPSKTLNNTEFQLFNGRVFVTFILKYDKGSAEDNDKTLLVDGAPASIQYPKPVGGDILLRNFKIEEGHTATAYIAGLSEIEAKWPKGYTNQTFNWECILLNGRNFSACRRQQIEAHTPTADTDGVLKSDYLFMALPFPTANAGLSGTFSKFGGYISDVTNYGNVAFKYRLYYPQAAEHAPNVPAAYLRALVSGRITAPSANPVSGIETTSAVADEMQAIAQSYIDAKTAGRKFSYGENWLYNNGTILNDSNGAGRMECDTFVQLILRGIDYEHSPYYGNETPNATFDYGTLVNNPEEYTWSDALLNAASSSVGKCGILDNKMIGRDIRFAANIAWLAWELSEFNKATLFTNASQARKGDIAFWKNENAGNGEYFDNITHVAFVGEIDGMKKLFEFVGNGQGGLRCIDLAARQKAPSYFARFKLS